MKGESAIVITGVGLEFPGIQDSASLLGTSPIAVGTHEFRPDIKLGRKGLRYKDQATKLALCAAKAALEDAKLPTSAETQISSETFGVVVSSNLGNLDTVCRVVSEIHSGSTNDLSPLDLPNASSNVIASTIAIRFGCKQLNLMLCNGATSGLDALYLAGNAIRAGRANRVLIVGVEPVNQMASRLMQESARAWLGYEIEMRLGEGAAAVIIEDAEEARRRNAPIYGSPGNYVYTRGIDVAGCIHTALKGNTSIDLWLTPNCMYGLTSSAVQHALNSVWAGPLPRCHDLGAMLGETYGAFGVLQCVAACTWLRTNGGKRTLMTAGAALDDGCASMIIDRCDRDADEKCDWEDVSHRGRPYRSSKVFFSDYPISIYEPVSCASPSATSIAMIHGMGAGWDIWETLQWGLSDTFRTYSLNLPWSGRENPRWPCYIGGAEWLRLGLQLVPKKTTFVVAHSFAANVLLEHLNSHGTGYLRGMVLISPFYKSRTEDFEWEVMTYYMNYFQTLLEQGLRARARTAGLTADYLHAMAKKIRERIAPLGWLQFFNTFIRTPMLELHQFSIPTLVIAGETDIASPTADCLALVQTLPNARLEIIPNCGHYCMLEQPHKVLSLVDKYVKEWSAVLPAI